MDYSKLKTRLKDKLTKEYKKTKHTEEYAEAEKKYKRTRDAIKVMEVELQMFIQAFSATTLYENIANSLANSLEMVKDTIKKQKKPRSEVTKEEPDVFSVFSDSMLSMANSTTGESSRQFESLSHSLKKVSSSRVQFKEGLLKVLDLIKESKDLAAEIDDSRLKILDVRQTIEACRSAEEEEKLQESFAEQSSKVYDEMKKYTSSPEMLEMALGITGALRGFFGDAYDGLAKHMDEK